MHSIWRAWNFELAFLLTSTMMDSERLSKCSFKGQYMMAWLAGISTRPRFLGCTKDWILRTMMSKYLEPFQLVQRRTQIWFWTWFPLVGRALLAWVLTVHLADVWPAAAEQLGWFLRHRPFYARTRTEGTSRNAEYYHTRTSSINTSMFVHFRSNGFKTW